MLWKRETKKEQLRKNKDTEIVSYGKLVTYMNDGTSLKSVRQIRRSEYPEYNLGNTRTAKLNILFGCTCEAS